MAGGYALSALMGLLGGAGQGAYEGYSSGITDQQKAAQLALEQAKLSENQRQFNEGKFTDVSPEQSTSLGLPAGKTANTLIPALLKQVEMGRGREEATRRAGETAGAFNQAATMFPEDVSRTGAMQEPEAAGTSPEQQPNRYIKAMGLLSGAQAPKEDTAMFTQFLKGQQAGGGTPSQLMMDSDGNIVAIPKPKGLAGPTQTGVAGMPTHNATSLAWQKYQTNPSPENLAAYNAVAQQSSTAPGGLTEPKSQTLGIIPGATAPGQRQVMGGPPGVQRAPGGGTYRPPYNTASEDEKIGMRNYVVNKLDQIAQQAGTMPQLESFKGRASLAIRGYLAGHTPLETLAPDEQKWVTLHENLRTQLIGLQTGLGSFRSPKMQALYEQVIGRYWSPQTQARIQELADMVREEGQAVSDVQGQQGKLQFNPPPKPPRANPAEAQSEQGWTDLGNGMRIRRK